MKGQNSLFRFSVQRETLSLFGSDSTGHFMVDPDKMKALQGGYVYLKPMLSKEFKPTLELVDYFSFN